MARPLLALALVALTAAGAAADDPFNQLPGAGGPDPNSFAEVATLSAEFSPAKGKPGDRLTLRLTVSPKPGYYTYPLSKPAAGADSTIQFAAGGPVVLAGDVPVPPGFTEHPKPAEPGVTAKHYQEPVTFEVPVVLSVTAAPGKQKVKLGGRIQVCSSKVCLNGRGNDLPAPELEVVADAAPGGNVKPLPDQREAVKPPETTPVAAADVATHTRSLDDVAAKMTGDTVGDSAVTGGLWGLLAAAVFWGFVSLATPCVFPMIPITVSLFLKQADQSTGTMIRLAAVYCLTIIVVLGGAAVALLTVFQQLSVNEWMNLFLGALFVFFALSLFGMFEVTLPRVVTFAALFAWAFVLYHGSALLTGRLGGERSQWAAGLGVGGVALAGLTYFLLSGGGAALESRLLQSTERGRKAGGVLGTVAGALAFSVVSFTCVAPFLGGFAGVLQSGGYNKAELAAAGLAFAAAFASPFFVLALFPSLVKKLPKSGGWLDTVKAVMGFLELAAAFKFLRTAELKVSGHADLFSYELCLAAWVGICTAAGLYLLNLYRLPHDFDDKRPVGVVQLVLAMLFLGLGAYLAPGLAGHRPAGKVYAWANAFLLPDDPAGAPGELPYTGDLKAALDQARAAPAGQRDRVFLDFTGVNCSNCKLNERDVFPRPEVQALLKRYRLVKLYADTVPPAYSPLGDADREELAAANARFQTDAFKNRQLPLYVTLAPQPDGTTRVVGVYAEGKINDPAAFAKFLEAGLTQ